MTRLSALKLEIICSQGSEADKHFPLSLSNGSFKIGRASASGNEKCLPGNGLFESKVMSRNHATISVKGDKVFVQDGMDSKGSSHGTYLGSNGSTDLLQRLTTEAHSLKSGDVLSFGKHVYGDDYQATNCQPVQVRVKIISNETKPKVIRRQFGLVTDESDGDLSLDELEALPNPSVPAPSARTPAEKMVNEDSPATVLRNPRRDRPNTSANDDSEMEISRGPSRVASPAVSALPNGHHYSIFDDCEIDDSLREILGIRDQYPNGNTANATLVNQRKGSAPASEAYSPAPAEASSSPVSERDSSPPMSDSDALASPVTSVHDDNEYKFVRASHSSDEELAVNKPVKSWNANMAAFAMTCEPFMEDEIDFDQTQAFPMQDDNELDYGNAPQAQDVIPSSVPNEVTAEMDTFMASDGPDPFLPDNKSEADPFEESQDARDKIEEPMDVIAEVPAIRTPVQEHSAECPPAPDLDQDLHVSPRYTFARSGSPPATGQAAGRTETMGKIHEALQKMKASIEDLQGHPIDSEAGDSSGVMTKSPLKRKHDEIEETTVANLLPSTCAIVPAVQVPAIHLSKRQRIATFTKKVALAGCWMALGSAATVIGLASMADED